MWNKACTSHTRDIPRDQIIKIKEIRKLVANLLCEGKKIRALLTRIAQRGLSVYQCPIYFFSIQQNYEYKPFSYFNLFNIQALSWKIGASSLLQVGVSLIQVFILAWETEEGGWGGCSAGGSKWS